MSTILNFILFQIAWFAAILGASHGMPWLGVVAVPVFVMLNLVITGNWKQTLLLCLAAAIIGFFTDTTLIVFGVFSPVPFPWPLPFSPLWMVMLWVNLAMTLNESMAWLRARYLLGAIFALIGGPMAYYSGAKLGVAALPVFTDLLVIGIAWAVAFPVLLWINELLRRRSKTP
jgi:hypothetical protein